MGSTSLLVNPWDGLKRKWCVNLCSDSSSRACNGRGRMPQGQRGLDEIPGAYKPIEQVMTNQSDLVEVVATLKQVMCVKGCPQPWRIHRACLSVVALLAREGIRDRE